MIKYRIRSYHNEGRRLLFTIEERGMSGEVRQYAEEIVAKKNWAVDFTYSDAAKIAYVAEDELGQS